MKKFKVSVNGKTYDVDVEEVGVGSTVTSQPVNHQTEAAPKSTVSIGGVSVVAPMQGKIVDIKVSENEMVKTGDVVAILEAMKMENEVVAHEDGTVVSINVATGQSVNTGDVIVTLN